MSHNARILIVDDEANARMALAELLRDEGYTVETAADGFKALPKLVELAPHLVLTDVKMPGMDGLELMKKVREHDPECVVVMMTAFGAVDVAVSAMRNGASDFLTKPINVEQMVLVIQRELERQRLRAEAGQLRQRLAEKHRLSNLIGQSPAMQAVFNTIHQVAPSRATVLITGESGTGKELVAAALHQLSPRAKGPFVKLHCAALAESLLESELFGHEKGSFTGAMTRREGRLEQAHGGTLFLDEIGDIPQATQVKLLRFLQEHELERVGGNATIRVDVRVVAATNRDLRKMVREGHFREDLYYRLHVVSIEMPPLRGRPSDIPMLAAHFLHKYARENGKVIESFHDAALERLVRYDWPGNVRELENTIERAVVVSRAEQIRVEDLSSSIAPRAATEGGPAIPGATMAEIEKHAILKTLELTGGATSRAAEILGISPRTIQYRLQEYKKGEPSSGDKPGGDGALEVDRDEAHPRRA